MNNGKLKCELCYVHMRKQMEYSILQQIQFSSVYTLFKTKFLRSPLRKPGWKDEFSAELWICLLYTSDAADE